MNSLLKKLQAFNGGVENFEEIELKPWKSIIEQDAEFRGNQSKSVYFFKTKAGEFKRS